MKTTLLRWLLAALPLAIALPPPVQAQDAPGAQAQAVYSKEQLDQLLAPIALYPDGVLAQVLMASTYPLEVVEAARWVKANPDIKGDAAVKAVEQKGWDVSVQSLVAFPQTITMMSDKLEWTQDLGNAVLAQQQDVTASIQRLRAMAQQAGTLESNEQQKVTVQPTGTTQTIIIEPAQPQTIYVPAYNPTVVYGTWPYPAYTPFYYPPNPYYYPGSALVRGFAWGVGFAAAGAIFGGFNWGRGDIDINVNRATNINRNFNATNINANRWQHNSTHRKGVAYKDAGSRERYGRNAGGAASREQFRGRDLERELAGGDRAQRGDRGGDRGQLGDRGQVGDRAGDRGQAGDRAGDRGQAGNRAGDRAGDRGQLQDRSREQARDLGSKDFGSRDAGSRDRGGARPQPAAFDGMGSRGSDVRAQSNRGQASRQASQANFGGGGARASGGGGGGGARMSGGGGGARGGGGGGRGGGGRR